jgi:hypothetical protein
MSFYRAHTRYLEFIVSLSFTKLHVEKLGESSQHDSLGTKWRVETCTLNSAHGRIATFDMLSFLSTVINNLHFVSCSLVLNTCIKW